MIPWLGKGTVNHHYDPLAFVVGSPKDLLDQVFCYQREHLIYRSEAIEGAIHSDKSVYIENQKTRGSDYIGPFSLTDPVYSRDVVVTVPANCRLGSAYHNCVYVLRSQQVRRDPGEAWYVSGYRKSNVVSL